MTDGPYRRPVAPDADEPPVDPARPWELQTWLSRRMCPTCKEALFAARKEGYRLDACGTCGGVWLARRDADRMLAEHSPIPANLAAIARKRARTGRRSLPGMPCPECSAPLVRTPTRQGPVVDTCASHGTWLDAGELEAIARPFAGVILPDERDGTPAPLADADAAMKQLGRADKTKAVLRHLTDLVFSHLVRRGS